MKNRYICKPIEKIFFTVCAVLMLSGCVGLVVYYPGECKNETPTTKARWLSEWERVPPSTIPTKADFLKNWGKPETIISTSEKTETWIYKRHLWCGMLPAFVIALPLMLPVCDGFEKIDFDGNYAKSLDIRRTLKEGTFLSVNGGYFWKRDPVCRYPLSDYGVGHDAAKPATQTYP